MQLVGLDIDAAFLVDAATEAAREGVAVELVCGNAETLPFADASFDVVLDFGTCYHVRTARWRKWRESFAKTAF